MMMSLNEKLKWNNNDLDQVSWNEMNFTQSCIKNVIECDKMKRSDNMT